MFFGPRALTELSLILIPSLKSRILQSYPVISDVKILLKNWPARQVTIWDYTLFEIGITEIMYEIGITGFQSNPNQGFQCILQSSKYEVSMSACIVCLVINFDQAKCFYKWQEVHTWIALVVMLQMKIITRKPIQGLKHFSDFDIKCRNILVTTIFFCLFLKVLCIWGQNLSSVISLTTLGNFRNSTGESHKNNFWYEN